MKAKKRGRFILVNSTELKKTNSRKFKYLDAKHIKIIDLGVIEEDMSYRAFFFNIGKDAAINAVNENKALHIPITFLQDGWVVRRMPNGDIEKISQIKSNEKVHRKRKLSKGTVLSVK